jgi:UDP-glucose 4-epimerase
VVRVDTQHARPRHRPVDLLGRPLAQELEQRPDVEVVVGVDTRDPRIPLERTEFVRTDSSYSILARIVRATQVDTIVHTHLVVDSTRASEPHAARDQRDRHDEPARGGGRVRQPGAQGRAEELGLVYGANKADPYFFREDMTTHGPPTTNVERSLLEVEAFVRDFADDSPHVDVTLLRFANVLGDDIDTPFTPRCAARSCPRSSASIRACSSCTKTTWSAR